jgi:hypothetical protein
MLMKMVRIILAIPLTQNGMLPSKATLPAQVLVMTNKNTVKWNIYGQEYD